jgi:hypothetical protein
MKKKKSFTEIYNFEFPSQVTSNDSGSSTESLASTVKLIGSTNSHGSRYSRFRDETPPRRTVRAVEPPSTGASTGDRFVTRSLIPADHLSFSQ